NAPEQFHAAATRAGEAHIRNDDVGSQSLEHLEGCVTVFGGFGLVARLDEVRPDGARERALVVHNEHRAPAHVLLPACATGSSAAPRLAACSAGRAGNVMHTRVPSPARLEMASVPPLCST